MTQENPLSVEPNQLYSVPLRNLAFAMYFAPDEQKAKVMHKRTFGEFCTKAYLVDHGMDISIYNPETKRDQTWREIRNELPELPAYAGIFQKN